MFVAFSFAALFPLRLAPFELIVVLSQIQAAFEPKITPFAPSLHLLFLTLFAPFHVLEMIVFGRLLSWIAFALLCLILQFLGVSNGLFSQSHP